MGLKDTKLLTLKEIEGSTMSHDGYLKYQMRLRQQALEHATSIGELAAYIGGEIVNLDLDEDWAIRKEVYPRVEIIFLFNHGDAEFPARLRVLYSGDRVRELTGEELASLAVSGANHMLRYIRETNRGSNVPDVCYRV